MSKTYNGRFVSPPEPPGGAKWLIGGFALMPLWSIPLIGLGVFAGSICCFVKAGKCRSERRMYNRFHEFCSVIGMRDRVPVRELARNTEMGKSEMIKYLQKMLAKGYFGSKSYLDLRCEELVLPAVEGYQSGQTHGSWKDIAFEVIDMLRNERFSRYTGRTHSGARKAPSAENSDTKQADQGKTADVQEPIQQTAESTQSAASDTSQTAGPRPASERKKDRKDYMNELEKTLNELYQLNEQIQDEAVSQRIDRIGALVAGIFRAVIDNPAREQDVRKFMNYYLPTTLKLLKSYDMLEKQSYQGENIAASRKKIENVLDMLIEAYEKQLDRLFSNDALDIATDVDVLEAMIAGDGLTRKGQMPMM